MHFPLGIQEEEEEEGEAAHGQLRVRRGKAKTATPGRAGETTRG